MSIYQVDIVNLDNIMQTQSQKVSPVAKLLKVQANAYNLDSALELAVFACNEPHKIHPYFQAVSWQVNKLNKIEILAVSGVSMVDKNAPIVRFLIKLIKTAIKFEKSEISLKFSIDAFKGDSALQKQWESFLPPFCQWLPYSKSGQVQAGLIVFHENGIPPACHELFVPVAKTFEHVWFSFDENKKKHFGLFARFTRSGIQKLAAIGIIALILAIPVRESALAPASVVATDPTIVSSSISGVIQNIHIEPNEFVNKGDLLISLDSDQLVSDLDIAEKELSSAQAELLIASQRSFNQEEARADVALFQSKVDGAQLLVEEAQLLLERSRIYASQDGLAIYTDKFEYLGQRVDIGQRIMLIADVEAVEIDIYMPVGDTIDFDVGDEVLLFLNTDPTNPIKAKLRQTSYEPRTRDNGDFVFQMKAEFDSSEFKGRIGWAGTAKVYSSSRLSLFMYLFRRPIASLRRFLGV